MFSVLNPIEDPSHEMETKQLSFGSFSRCKNCNSWSGAAALYQPCLYPQLQPAPEPAPSKRDLCWSCDRELSSYLDACYSKALYLEKRCRDCRERVAKAVAEFDAKFP